MKKGGNGSAWLHCSRTANGGVKAWHHRSRASIYERWQPDFVAVDPAAASRFAVQPQALALDRYH